MEDGVEISGQKARHLYNRVDLSDDGQDEVLVYMLGSFFCGTGGCNLLILRQTDGRFVVINNFATSRVPVMVRKEESNGWRNLVRLTSGGGAEPEHLLLEFDGEKYGKGEPIGAESAFKGTAVLADEITFESGIPLEPQR